MQWDTEAATETTDKNARNSVGKHTQIRRLSNHKKEAAVDRQKNDICIEGRSQMMKWKKYWVKFRQK